jgi:hypothetical protein
MGATLEGPRRNEKRPLPQSPQVPDEPQADGAVLKLANPGWPTLIQDKDAAGALYVLMPMRV